MFKTLSILLFSLTMLLVSCSEKIPNTWTKPGVSVELAAMRSNQITNPMYLLYVDVPENTAQQLDASLVLEFFMGEVSQPVILDFHPDESYLLAVFHKGENLPYSYKNGHIIIDKNHFEAGQQQLEFHFTLPESVLFKSENYLMAKPFTQNNYLAFPAFNQADLPASFLLNMEMPAEHKALSNALILKETQVSKRRSVAFAKSPILAVDEFSFVVGQLRKAEYNAETKSLDFYYAGNTIPDSLQLAQFAAEFVAKDTVTISQFGFYGKTDLVILSDLEVEKMIYLPGLVYVGGDFNDSKP